MKTPAGVKQNATVASSPRFVVSKQGAQIMYHAIHTHTNSAKRKINLKLDNEEVIYGL